METVLYPWTKPELTYKGVLSWNSPSHPNSNGTFQDWWDYKNLPYRYDEYLEEPPLRPIVGPGPDAWIGPGPGDPHKDAVRILVYFAASDFTAWDFSLWYREELVGTISILSALGGTCARCANRDEACLPYEASETFDTAEEAKKADKTKFHLTCDEDEIEISKIEIEEWRKQKIVPSAVALSVNY